MPNPLRASRRTRLAAGLVTAALAAPLLLAAPADAAASGLAPGTTLGSGAALAVNGYTLNMQSDGNLVEYHGSSVVWDSGTAGQAGNYLAMQTDGNLVVYSAGGAWRWQSTTNGHSGARLQLQTDGNVVVYSSGNTALWAQTWRQSASGAQAYALQSFVHYGWASSQDTYLVELWNRESNWRWNADNASSGAYGIPQALPASKLAANGPDWQTDGQTQVAWGLDYIHSRYGTPQAAWSHEQSYGWY